MELKEYQLQAINALLADPHKRFLIAPPGIGKTAIAFKYLEAVDKPNVLFVTTPSVRDSNQLINEAVMWNGEEWLPSRQRFEIVSWSCLARWLIQHQQEIMRDPDSWAIIFDECLPADTLVQTNKGMAQIADLKVGDKVLSYNVQTKRTEYKNVTRLIKKPAPEKMYCLHHPNGTIISTGNHPHYTQRGWIEAKDIKVGDTLYELCDMRQNDRHTKRKPTTQAKKGQARLLWLRLWDGGFNQRHQGKEQGARVEAPNRKVWGVHTLQPMRKEVAHERLNTQTNKRYGEEEQNILHTRMCTCSPCQSTKRKDEKEQSCNSTRSNEESYGYQEGKRGQAYMDRAPRLTRRQRALYYAAACAMAGTVQDEQWLGDGTTCESRRGKGKRLPNLLQVRHWKCLLQNRSRMRWRQPQFKGNQSQGQKETGQIRGIRVESIEVLEQGDIREYQLYRDPDYVYCIDVEDNHNFFANGILTHNCHKGKAGVRSKRGKAFLKLTHLVKTWIGMTATPGDSWIDFQAYAVATGLVRNLTEFKRKYCMIVTYRGFEDITGYQNENELDAWWSGVSFQLDPNLLGEELPPRVHHIQQFPAPTDYKKTVKTSIAPDGTFLDTASVMRHWCRQACATAKARRTWIADFIESVPDPIVFFTNYDCEDEMIAEVHKKTYPKAKVWFINGNVHDIPTADTIGAHDIVVAKYPSACEGLNLQFIHYCVMVSPNDSYSVSDQVRGRIRRHGQTMPQQYYYLQAKGTVEMAIYKALKNKSDFNWDRWKPENDLD